MKTLYFDCGMGAAGDMLMASLYEICPDKEKFLKIMNEMGLPGLSVEAEPSVKCGIHRNAYESDDPRGGRGERGRRSAGA